MAQELYLGVKAELKKAQKPIPSYEEWLDNHCEKQDLTKAKKGTAEYDEWLRKYREKRHGKGDSEAAKEVLSKKEDSEKGKTRVAKDLLSKNGIPSEAKTVKGVKGLTFDSDDDKLVNDLIDNGYNVIICLDEEDGVLMGSFAFKSDEEFGEKEIIPFYSSGYTGGLFPEDRSIQWGRSDLLKESSMFSGKKEKEEEVPMPTEEEIKETKQIEDKVKEVKSLIDSLGDKNSWNVYYDPSLHDKVAVSFSALWSNDSGKGHPLTKEEKKVFDKLSKIFPDAKVKAEVGEYHASFSQPISVKAGVPTKEEKKFSKKLFYDLQSKELPQKFSFDGSNYEVKTNKFPWGGTETVLYREGDRVDRFESSKELAELLARKRTTVKLS